MHDTTRKAIALIRRLSQADRDWLLARLAPAERALIDRAMKTPAEALAHEPAAIDPASLGDGMPALMRADASAMHEVLREEPAWLVGVLLAQRAWPWADDLLAHCAPARRARLVAARAAAVRTPTPFAQALLAQVEARWSALPGSQASPAQLSRFDARVASLRQADAAVGTV